MEGSDGELLLGGLQGDFRICVDKLSHQKGKKLVVNVKL